MAKIEYYIDNGNYTLIFMGEDSFIIQSGMLGDEVVFWLYGMYENGHSASTIQEVINDCGLGPVEI